MDKNDIAISSRITDFNVQISAVNIGLHSHCSQMFGQNYMYKLTTYVHSNICVFCDQTHGRTNELLIKIIIFFL